jgi:hypothetical protein
MNRRRSLPLKRLKIGPGNGEGPADLKRTFRRIGLPGVVIASCIAVVIGLGIVCLFALRKSRSPGRDRPAIVLATATPPAVNQKIQAGPTVITKDSARPGTSVAESTPHDVSPPASPVSTPTPEPTAIASDNQSREIKPSEVERKNIERERRTAERKRSQLESMYQKHLISDEAYKKGQDEYKNEMAKYRNTLNGATSANE